jgi:hypothetical protein
MRHAATHHWTGRRHYVSLLDAQRPVLICAMCVGSPTAGTSSISPSPPDNEFETDRRHECALLPLRRDRHEGKTPNQISTGSIDAWSSRTSRATAPASMGGLRDANGRQWRAGSAPALPPTGATTTAKTAKTDGQLGESASSNERGRRVGGAGQESRAGGLDASPGPIGPQHAS